MSYNNFKNTYLSILPNEIQDIISYYEKKERYNIIHFELQVACHVRSHAQSFAGKSAVYLSSPKTHQIVLHNAPTYLFCLHWLLRPQHTSVFPCSVCQVTVDICKTETVCCFCCWAQVMKVLQGQSSVQVEFVEYCSRSLLVSLISVGWLILFLGLGHI